jgi:hypothetical protein
MKTILKINLSLLKNLSLTLLCIIFLTACSKEDINETEFSANLTTSIEKTPIGDMTIEEFYSTFSDHEVTIEDNYHSLIEALEIWEITDVEFHQMTLEKEEYINTQLSCGETCTPLTEGEIFAAMMKECENYYLLEAPCKLAVEIAYVLR